MLEVQIHLITMYNYAKIFQQNYLNLIKKLSFLDENAIENILYLFTKLHNLDFVDSTSFQATYMGTSSIAFIINISLKGDPNQFLNYVIFKNNL